MMGHPFDPHHSDSQFALERFGIDLTAGINLLSPSSPLNDAMELRFGLLANWVLTRHALIVDADNRAKLLKEVDRAATDAIWRLKRAANGDYSPDPAEQRFPPIRSLSAPLTLTDLFERWRSETKPAASTVTTWKAFISYFVTKTGKSQADSIRTEDVIAWKDMLVGDGLALNTINRTHLSGLKAILNFGCRNKIILNKPASSVRVLYRPQAGQRMLPYSDEEVARLLALAQAEQQTYRHWLPILAAGTGARIGELEPFHLTSTRLDSPDA